ncbi:MAG: glycosyltransferase family 9 protein [Ktedonobacterales bacterium]
MAPHSKRYIPNPPAPVSLCTQPRILVVKLASLGDVLLATPALRALRRRYPAALLDVLTTGASAELLRASPLVDHVYTLDKYAFDTPGDLLRRPWRLLQPVPLLAALRRNDYTAVLLLHHLTLAFGRLKYRALLAALHPRCTVGLDNGYGGFLDVRVPDLGFGDRHEAEYARAVAEAVDATLPARERGVRLADLGWAEVAHQPDTMVPLVALHPGSGGYSLARRWPAERYAELAGALHHDTGARVVLVGGADERELHERILGELRAQQAMPLPGTTWQAASAQGTIEWATSEAGQHAPRELARRLGECAVFVGNDSFPMHLAAAVGTPVVAIFGPSNARAWGPYVPDAPRRAVVVRRLDVPCSPCFYRGHALGTPEGCPARPCLTGLEMEPVLRATYRLLEASRADAAPAG